MVAPRRSNGLRSAGFRAPRRERCGWHGACKVLREIMRAKRIMTVPVETSVFSWWSSYSVIALVLSVAIPAAASPGGCRALERTGLRPIRAPQAPCGAARADSSMIGDSRAPDGGLTAREWSVRAASGPVNEGDPLDLHGAEVAGRDEGTGLDSRAGAIAQAAVARSADFTRTADRAIVQAHGPSNEREVPSRTRSVNGRRRVEAGGKPPEWRVAMLIGAALVVSALAGLRGQRYHGRP